jgi:DNA invertase Pin-like site-specific DNA recombinase
MRVALYYRVSTEDQTTEPQRLELLEYCRRRGWGKVTEFRDVISGAKTARIGLDMLMRGVRKHQFDAVLVAKLDRLGRSLPHLAQLIAEMETHKVALVATTQGIDTTEQNPAGRLQMHVLMAVAEFEREIIRERTKAGLKAAVARGSKLGRKARQWTPEEVATIEAHEGTVAGLARKLGCSLGTAHKLLKRSVPVDSISPTT